MSQTIKINKKATPNFRPNSARAKYYEVLAAHDGKELNSFVEAVAKNPPSVPARGKLQGKPEPVQGWISWFVRNGYATIATSK